jgi:hypothetical protein
MTLKPDHLLILAAGLVGMVLIARAGQVKAKPAGTGSLDRSGSPEQLYAGMHPTLRAWYAQSGMSQAEAVATQRMFAENPFAVSAL